jgi:hypothetical protein
MTGADLEAIRNLSMGRSYETGSFRVRRVPGGVVLTEIIHQRQNPSTLDFLTLAGGTIFISLRHPPIQIQRRTGMKDYGRCMVCHKPVPKISSYSDPETGESVLTAYCHGKKHTIRLGPDATIKDVPRYWFMAEAEARSMGATRYLYGAAKKLKAPTRQRKSILRRSKRVWPRPGTGKGQDGVPYVQASKASKLPGKTRQVLVGLGRVC